MALSFVAGPNFSGRSEHLVHRAQRAGGAYLHPDLELNLSGLANTVAGEIFLHAAASSQPHKRVLRTLSGGERAELVLDCALAMRPPVLSVDCALEQLDPAHRASALAQITAYARDHDVWLSDNRMDVGDFDHVEAADAPDVGGQVPPRDFNQALHAAAEKLRPGGGAPVIRASGLSFSYPRSSAPVFEATSFTLSPGKLHLLKAPNGAGKSTLARLLLGVLRPDAGRIEADDCTINASNRPFFYAFQNARDQIFGRSLLGYLGEAARLGLKRRHPWHVEWGLVDEAAAAFGLASFADAEVWDLPSVALKRLGLAAAFASHAPWLFLDEPALGLDYEGREALGRLLARAAGCGRGIVVVSHGDEFDRLPEVQFLSITGGALIEGGGP